MDNIETEAGILNRIRIDLNKKMDQEKFHKILFLASTDGAHTHRSGYTLLTEYLPEGDLIEVNRNSANTILKRLSDALCSRISLSSWCRRSSFVLELKALMYIKEKKPEIVHTLWGDRDIGFIDYFRKGSKFKLVCSVHNVASMLDETFNFPKRFKSFDALILMSKVQKPYFEKIGVPAEKIHVVLHGIDCNYFKPAPQLKDTPFTILSVGNWQRNFNMLSEICRQLGKVSNIKVRIISLEKFKHLYEGMPNVVFQSRLSDEELLQAYQQASCFLMTARDATANNALLEALACGLPIVSERVGGIPEYVNEKCALFCNDVDSFVGNIIKLSTSPQLQKEMSLAARQRAEQLDWKESAKEMREIYKSLIDVV
ncbi:MAG: glycosyltransferase family 4 protein [Segetibacter sp.]